LCPETKLILLNTKQKVLPCSKGGRHQAIMDETKILKPEFSVQIPVLSLKLPCLRPENAGFLICEMGD
jgi:hypothetical protein